MRKIKRYPNRKLYDTVRRKYVTLQTIADLVREGEKIQVVDTKTGRDVTKSTLSKIVLDKQGDDEMFSNTFLTDIIQKVPQSITALPQSITGFFKRSIQVGKDVADWIEEEVERSVKKAVKVGGLKLTEADALKKDLTKRLKKKLIDSEISIEQRIVMAVERALHVVRLPTQTDLDKLRGTIDELSYRVESLGENGTSSGKRQKSRAKRKVPVVRGASPARSGKSGEAPTESKKSGGQGARKSKAKAARPTSARARVAAARRRAAKSAAKSTDASPPVSAPANKSIPVKNVNRKEG